MKQPFHLQTRFLALKARFTQLREQYEVQLRTGQFGRLNPWKQKGILRRLEKYRRQLEQLWYFLKKSFGKGTVATGLALGALTFTSCGDDDEPGTTRIPLTSINLAAQTGASNPFNGLNTGYTAAPAFVDIDNDGDLDVFVGNLYGTILFFRNTGSASSPTFTAVTGAGNPFNGVDVGNNSTPAFADIDGDGDQDAFVGEDYPGRLVFFRNTGSATAPVFTEQTGANNPLDGVGTIANGFTTYASPAFADLDGDGDQDLLLGQFSGTYGVGVSYTSARTIRYFRNSGGTFTEQTGTANPFNGLEFGSSYTGPSPALVDIDKDGDLDAFVGQANFTPSGVSGTFEATVRFFENTGSVTNPVMTERTGTSNPARNISLDDTRPYIKPAFADLDNDGDEDLFVGIYDASPSILYYRNQ
ncbi:MAG: VCBS repeat-containing protein [Microscillaceae bacterium]|nr:VCBS repeat-containing protein [Microscillaceae bacterium]